MTDRSEKNIVLFIAILGSFFPSFMMSGVTIATPAIGTEFNMNAVWLNWVSISFLLTSTVLLVPFSKMADKYGYKKIFLIGTIIFTVISLCTPLAHSTVVFIVLRALQGIGGAMQVVTSMAIVTNVFPAGERGRAIGITLAAIYFGISTGPFFGGLLTQYLGWRSVFLVNVPFGLVVIGVILWKLKGEWTHPSPGKFDLTGAVIYALSLVALIYGLSLLPALASIWIVLVSVLGIFVFIWWEARTQNPVMPINLFRTSRLFAFSNLAALISYSATMSIAFLLSLYLQYNKGMDPTVAGLILMSMPLVQTVFSPVSGRLSDRIEPVYLASMGMGINAVGLVCLALIGQDSQVWFIVLGLVIMGFGSALFVSPNTNAIIGTVDKAMYSAANATLSTMRQLGAMVSQGLTMMMFALLIGRVEITPQYYGAFLTSQRTVFAISAVLCVIGIFLSLARGKR